MCFDERKTPVNCITLFSFIVLLCGIIMLVFSVLGTNSAVLDNLKDAKSMSDLDSASKLMAIFFYGLSVFIIIVAILGFLFRCCKSCCYAVCYGVVMFPVWLLLFVFGGMAVGIATAGQDDIVKYCNEIADEVSNQSGKTDVQFDLNIYD